MSGRRKEMYGRETDGFPRPPFNDPNRARRGPPQVRDELNSRILKGKDLSEIITLCCDGPVRDAKGFTLAGSVQGMIFPMLVFTGGSYPAPVQFRTGANVTPGGVVILQKWDGDLSLGDMTLISGIPLTLDSTNTFDTIVRPGERWYAGSDTQGAIITVIERAILLLDGR